MMSWFARSLFFVFCLIAASFFEYMCAPSSPAFYESILILSISTVCISEALRYIAHRFSYAILLNVLTASVLGIASAALIQFCVIFLTRHVFIPYPFDSFVSFLLPTSTILLAFWGLQVFSCFKVYDSTSLQIGTKNSTNTFIPDQFSLEDGRIIDFARTGLLNGKVIVPMFLPQYLKSLLDSVDEIERLRAKKALDTLRQLEILSELNLAFVHASATHLDLEEDLVRFARSIQGTILTSDIAHLDSEGAHEIYLSLDTIANTLRPPIPKGESLAIKIQRLGKEPKQGIGYLEDGTMVVVNGGGDFLGKIVRTQVLSQKLSSSGKIVFCNVREEDLEMAMPYAHSEGAYSKGVL